MCVLYIYNRKYLRVCTGSIHIYNMIFFFFFFWGGGQFYDDIIYTTFFSFFLLELRALKIYKKKLNFRVTWSGM